MNKNESDLNRDLILRVARECGLELSVDPCVLGQIIERFAAAMYTKGTEDMREQIIGSINDSDDRLMGDFHIERIRAIPITTNKGNPSTSSTTLPNTEGEQG